MNRKSEAIFGLQCFWGSEAKFGALNGVISTSVGYTGGSTPNPTYKNLSDHTEVVKIEFDSQLISFKVRNLSLIFKYISFIKMITTGTAGHLLDIA